MTPAGQVTVSRRVVAEAILGEMPLSGQRLRDRGNYGRPVVGSGRGWARPRSSLTHLTGRQYPGGTAMWGGSWPSSSPQCNSEWTQISAHLGQSAASGRGLKSGSGRDAVVRSAAICSAYSQDSACTTSV